ncbi:MAG: nucleotidyltransferase domain-containing protein, partial [Ktedonobacteraceae bacterium]
MEEHHRRVIQRLVEQFKDNLRFPALIIGGSVAKGRARKDSDIDILLVANKEEYARREATQDFWYLDREKCYYPVVYVEGKIINMQFLVDAAKRGSEPARAAFSGAFVGYSRIPELEGLLQRIPVYQEQEHREKIEAFYSQVLLLNWLVAEAGKRKDSYLLTHAVSNLVL